MLFQTPYVIKTIVVEALKVAYNAAFADLEVLQFEELKDDVLYPDGWHKKRPHEKWVCNVLQVSNMNKHRR